MAGRVEEDWDPSVKSTTSFVKVSSCVVTVTLSVSYFSDHYGQGLDQKQIKRGSIHSESWFRRPSPSWWGRSGSHTVAGRARCNQVHHDVILAGKNQRELGLESEWLKFSRFMTVNLYLPARLHVQKALSLPK